MQAEHSALPHRIRPPSRRLLLLAAVAALVVALAVLAMGATLRARAAQRVAAWTDDQAIPTVSLARLSVEDAGGELTLPGDIQPFNKAAIYARVSGYLKQWSQDIGAPVKAGQTLATIETPDLDQQLQQARADLANAQANLQLANLTSQRWRALESSQAVAQQAVDEKAGDAAAKAALRDSAAANLHRLEALEGFKTLAAPFSGVVTARNTDIGALINAGGGAVQPLFEVSDLKTVRIYVQVPQTYSGELHPGLKASFEALQYPGRTFTATLATVSHAMNPASRSMLVELHADNSDGALQAGSYCQVRFDLPSAAKAIRLPATALAPTDRGVAVAVIGSDGKAILKSVELGRDYGDSVDVVSGLSPTDRVVDSPPETLQTGQPVHVAAPASPASAG